MASSHPTGVPAITARPPRRVLGQKLQQSEFIAPSGGHLLVDHSTVSDPNFLTIVSGSMTSKLVPTTSIHTTQPSLSKPAVSTETVITFSVQFSGSGIAPPATHISVPLSIKTAGFLTSTTSLITTTTQPGTTYQTTAISTSTAQPHLITPSTTSSASTSSSGPSAGTIAAAVVVPIVIFLLLLAFGIWFCLRRRRMKRASEATSTTLVGSEPIPRQPQSPYNRLSSGGGEKPLPDRPSVLVADDSNIPGLSTAMYGSTDLTPLPLNDSTNGSSPRTRDPPNPYAHSPRNLVPPPLHLPQNNLGPLTSNQPTPRTAPNPRHRVRDPISSFYSESSTPPDPHAAPATGGPPLPPLPAMPTSTNSSSPFADPPASQRSRSQSPAFSQVSSISAQTVTPAGGAVRARSLTREQQARAAYGMPSLHVEGGAYPLTDVVDSYEGGAEGNSYDGGRGSYERPVTPTRPSPARHAADPYDYAVPMSPVSDMSDDDDRERILDIGALGRFPAQQQQQQQQQAPAQQQQQQQQPARGPGRGPDGYGYGGFGRYR